MRVVILNDFSIARGGATAMALLATRKLHDRGIPVTYITGDGGNEKVFGPLGTDTLVLDDKPLLDLPARQAIPKGLFNRAAHDRIAAWICEHDTPDTIYHLHNWSLILSPAVFSALQQVAARTIVHAHDFFLACPNGVFMDFRRNEFCDRKPLGLSCIVTNCDKRSYAQKGWRVLRQVALKRSFTQSLPWAAIALIHPDMAGPMARAGYPRDNMITLRNPVDPFTQTRIRAEDNDQLVFVGRVDTGKGVEELVAAAVATGQPLTVIGDGVLREPLAATYPQVQFTGWKEPDQIGPLLARARAVVMPSQFREPFGLVAVEASRSGLPVVLSDTAFLAPEIAGNGLGWACDTRDAESFARTLAQVRDLPKDQIRAMSERGFSRKVPLAHTPDSWVDALVALYRTTLAA